MTRYPPQEKFIIKQEKDSHYFFQILERIQGKRPPFAGLLVPFSLQFSRKSDVAAQHCQPRVNLCQPPTGCKAAATKGFDNLTTYF